LSEGLDNPLLTGEVTILIDNGCLSAVQTIEVLVTSWKHNVTPCLTMHCLGILINRSW
jgi:hypothetical protein